MQNTTHSISLKNYVFIRPNLRFKIRNWSSLKADSTGSGKIVRFCPFAAACSDYRRTRFRSDANTGDHVSRLSQNAALQHRSVIQLFDSGSRSEIYRLLRDRSNESAQTIHLLDLRVGGEIVVCDVHLILLHEEDSPDGRTVLLFVDKSSEIVREAARHA
jgi:hypothetical protein